MAPRLIRIGTRGSALALAQALSVLQELRRRHPQHLFAVEIIETHGDVNQGSDLFDHSATGVFTKEIQRALLQNKIDIAVHSLKDLPTKGPRALTLAAFPKREACEDVLIFRRHASLKQLPSGARIGTSSLRRTLQLKRLRGDLRFDMIRGNVNTRLKKLSSGAFDAIVLAKAGLNRLRLHPKKMQTLSVTQMIPSACQGILGIEVRAKDKAVIALLKTLDHAPSRREAEAERACLAGLQAGCRVPIGILARCKGTKITLSAGVFSVKDDRVLLETAQGPARNAASIGRRVAKKLLARGAGGWLREARKR